MADISEVKVLKEDLESLRAIMDTMHHKSVLEDMLEGYRKLNTTVRYSKYTQEIARHISKLDAYIDPIEESDDA